MFPSQTDMGSHNHRPVTRSDNICNTLNPLLINISRFDMLCIAVSITIFKTRLLRRAFRTIIKNALLSSPPMWDLTRIN